MSDLVVDQSRAMIRAGSKSFFAAARIFDPPARRSAYMLYAWCRYCDDQIDFQHLGHGTDDTPGESAATRLEDLRRETERAVSGEPVDHPVFVGLQRVVEEHQIPDRHPFELLEGFRMDVEGRSYETFEETLDYCYHVAGVVGVMMAYVMGSRDEPTLDRAADLGIGFQLTNIARDVMDDAAIDRIYLPNEWLLEAGIRPEEIADPENRVAVAEVVDRMLAQADRYYESSGAGIARLRPRHAWAIATARGVYRDIGRLVRARGARAWDQRVSVGLPRKLWLMLSGGAEALWATGFRRSKAVSPRRDLWQRPRPESS